MNTQTAGSKSLNIVALGWGFSAALIVLFVICMISSFILPDLPASQGWAAWMALFSVTQTDRPFLSSLRPIVLSCHLEFGSMAFFSVSSLAG